MLVTVISVVTVEAAETSTMVGRRYRCTIRKLLNGRRVLATMSVAPAHAEILVNKLSLLSNRPIFTSVSAEPMYIFAVGGVLESLPAVFSALVRDPLVKVIMIAISTAMLSASNSFRIFTEDKMVASVMTHDGET